MKGFGMRSPFQFFDEDAIRNEALKRELTTIVDGVFPLLSRLAEIISTHNLQGAQAQIATPSGLVFGIINDRRKMIQQMMKPTFFHDGQPIPTDPKNLPPEAKKVMIEGLEELLKNLRA